MKIGPIVASIILDVPSVCGNTLLSRDRGQLAHALLLLRRCWVAKLPIRAVDTAHVTLTECSILLESSKRRDLIASCVVATTIIHSTKTFAIATLVSAYERRHLVLAFLPYPDVLRIVTAPAVLIDWQLTPSA